MSSPNERDLHSVEPNLSPAEPDLSSAEPDLSSAEPEPVVYKTLGDLAAEVDKRGFLSALTGPRFYFSFESTQPEQVELLKE